MAASSLCVSLDVARLSSITSSRSSQSSSSRASSVDKLALPCSSLSSIGSSHTSPCSARHISLLFSSSPRKVCRSAALAFHSDFFHIPYTEGIPVGSKLNLFNLPYNCDRQALIEHFGTCGAVVESLEITNNSEEEGNASGSIVLGSLDEACAAVAQLDGARFQGKCLRMDFVQRRPHETNQNSGPRARSRPTPSMGENRIYVGNLPWRVDDSSLEQLFSAHGIVQEARVMRDRDSGRSRGFGFVMMSTAAEMEKAMAALDGSEIEGRALRVNAAALHGMHHGFKARVERIPCKYIFSLEGATRVLQQILLGYASVSL